MNKDDALAKLLEIVGLCLIDEMFVDELLNIIKNSGVENSILNMLLYDIRILLEFKENARLVKPKRFEKLKTCELYSIIIKAEHNIRILYHFINERPILLLAFYERSGKKRTDYSNKINEAEKRLKKANNTYNINNE